MRIDTNTEYRSLNLVGFILSFIIKIRENLIIRLQQTNMGEVTSKILGRQQIKLIKTLTSSFTIIKVFKILDSLPKFCSKNCAYRDSKSDMLIFSPALCRLVHSRPRHLLYIVQCINLYFAHMLYGRIVLLILLHYITLPKPLSNSAHS